MRVRKLLYLVIGIGLGFFLHIAWVHFLFPLRANTVIIKNDSSRNINTILLAQENQIKKNLLQGQSAEMKFYVFGESHYELIAEFDDGTFIRGGSGYVEPGYKESQIITDKEVKQEHIGDYWTENKS